MPLPDYPVTLPYKPDAGSFSHKEHHQPALVTQVEDGPDIMRVQSNTRIKKMAYTLIFTDEEFVIWEAFAETTLQQGTINFMMLVPVAGNTFVSRQVYLENGQWTDTPYGAIDWAVSFTLCVLPAA